MGVKEGYKRKLFLTHKAKFIKSKCLKEGKPKRVIINLYRKLLFSIKIL
jgi:hypothetical protein